MSATLIDAIPFATASFVGGNSTTPTPQQLAAEQNRIDECVAKKNLSCFSELVLQSTIAREISLRSDLYTFKLWEGSNLDKIQEYLKRVDDLETCILTKHNHVPKSLTRSNVDYFKKYFKEIQKEHKRIGELNTYTNSVLNNEITLFEASKKKNDFERFQRELEKTEQEFKDILRRRSVSTIVDLLSKFEKEAEIFAKGKCAYEHLGKFNVSSFGNHL